MLPSRPPVASLIAFVLLACACGSEPSTPSAAVTSPPDASATPSAIDCGDPHAHVYSPDRPRLYAACISLSRTIQSETPQADGDFHVRLRVDAGQSCAGRPCLNGGNTSEQAGDLVLEPVCENPISQADAVDACQGYHNPLVIGAFGLVIALGVWLIHTTAR